MNKQPLLICTIFFIIGIFFQEYFQMNFHWILGGFLVAILGFGLGFIKTIFFDKIKSVFLVFLFFNLGILSHSLNFHQTKNFNFPENKTQNIEFQLTKKLNSNERNKRYEIEILNFGTHFSAVVSVPKEQKELDFKSIYSAEAYLNPTEKPQHDFQFDYQKYLARQDIHYQVFISNEIFAKPKQKISFWDRIKQKRLDLLTKIDQSSLKTENKALLKGIILADRTEISREIINNFSKTGLIHILAISGSHMAIIFLMILFVLKPIFSVKQRNFPIYISLIIIWLFAIFINFGNSVVRSCIMITAYYLMIFLQRKPNLLHSMALSALIILIIDSQQLFDVGFQLSFLAVFGIFWLYKPITNYYKSIKNPVLRFTLNTFSLSLAAQLTTLPLVVFYFHQLSLMSVFINVVSIMISQAFIIFSFIISILFGLNLTNNWILTLYDWSASFFLNVINFFAENDFSFIENIPLEIPELIIFLAIMYLLREILEKPNTKIWLRFSFLIGIFVLMRISFNFYFQEKEEVLEHKYFNEQVVSIKKGKNAQFLVSEASDLEKIQNYIIKPYIASRRIEDWDTKLVKTPTTLKINNKNYEIK